MYVVYFSCDFVTKMIIKKIWKSSLISGLWFGIVQFLNRNIQACIRLKLVALFLPLSLNRVLPLIGRDPFTQ